MIKRLKIARENFETTDMKLGTSFVLKLWENEISISEPNNKFENKDTVHIPRLIRLKFIQSINNFLKDIYFF